MKNDDEQMRQRLLGLLQRADMDTLECDIDPHNISVTPYDRGPEEPYQTIVMKFRVPIGGIVVPKRVKTKADLLAYLESYVASLKGERVKE